MPFEMEVENLVEKLAIRKNIAYAKNLATQFVLDIDTLELGHLLSLIGADVSLRLEISGIYFKLKYYQNNLHQLNVKLKLKEILPFINILDQVMCSLYGIIYSKLIQENDKIAHYVKHYDKSIQVYKEYTDNLNSNLKIKADNEFTAYDLKKIGDIIDHFNANILKKIPFSRAEIYLKKYPESYICNYFFEDNDIKGMLFDLKYMLLQNIECDLFSQIIFAAHMLDIFNELYGSGFSNLTSIHNRYQKQIAVKFKELQIYRAKSIQLTVEYNRICGIVIEMNQAKLNQQAAPENNSSYKPDLEHPPSNETSNIEQNIPFRFFSNPGGNQNVARDENEIVGSKSPLTVEAKHESDKAEQMEQLPLKDELLSKTPETKSEQNFIQRMFGKSAPKKEATSSSDNRKKSSSFSISSFFGKSTKNVEGTLTAKSSSISSSMLVAISPSLIPKKEGIN